MKMNFTFTPRTHNALINGYWRATGNEDSNGKFTGEHLTHLRQLEKYSLTTIDSWRGVGKAAMAEIKEAFRECGLTPLPEQEDKDTTTTIPVDKPEEVDICPL